jgi:exopolyphosphatase/guanosine-5'-triphosphate,3'-diphosphate pyrophosphatase
LDTQSRAGIPPVEDGHRLSSRRPDKERRKNGKHGNAVSALQLRESSTRIYGALDLGTNNCRLLLATPGTTSFKVVDAFSRIVRLGEGVTRSGSLNEEAMRRTISAVRVCANKLKWWQCTRHRLIATEACRMARNGPAFIERVTAETGIELEIIDRHTEASLAVAGASALVDSKARTVLIFDIGGGSTELMWVDAINGRHEIIQWTSLPAGVVTLAEKFGGRDVSLDAFTRMRAYVRPMLSEFAQELCALDSDNAVPSHLLGTSGTVTTICGVQLGLRRYDRSRVDGCWLRNEDIGEVTRQLLAMPYRERAASPCIGAERADLVLAGCAILEEIRETWPAAHVRVADRGLREGILTQLMSEDSAYAQE